MSFVYGEGLINSLINKLPFELHIPSYQYCGPGTKLQKRLARGDPGINPLDAACKEHDIAYSRNKDNLEARHKADSLLEQRAWERVKSRDAGVGEKTAAWAVTNIMKTKRRFGMGLRNSGGRRRSSRIRKGLKKKMIAFGSGIVHKAREAIKNGVTGNDLEKAAKIALSVARQSIKASGGRKNIRTPRILPIPKTGGIIPLIPLFAGLSALGSFAGGAAGIAKVITDVKKGRKDLEEATRHNKTMEAIALGKRGSGLYLRPYRKGLGLYLNPYPKNF